MTVIVEIFAMGFALIIGTWIGWCVKKWKTPPPKPEQPDFVKVGGKLIDANQWPPALLEKIRKEYFLPPAANGNFVRADLVATCPEKHSTIVRVGILTTQQILLDELLGAIQKGKAQTPCSTCSKPSRIAGKTIVWTGSLRQWDGAT